MGGDEFSAQHGFMAWNRVGAIGITADDSNHAMRSPVLGWPTFRAPFGVDGPGTHLTYRILGTENIRNSKAPHSCTRERGTDLLSVASGEVGATIAPPHDSRLLYGRGGTECPLDGTQYEVRTLPGRRINGRPTF